ncbi:hypothetical protein V6N11_069913 [Hibiscus sabdariffa]|uniref:Uncharacterized protein n=1 Tax=Hibiscus sabdariffa TaxID=183260 RepID=A0ABR2NHF3_9ROSI
MPNYAKFLKDMVSRKTRIGEFDIAAAIKACLSMMHNKVPTKKTDPRSFTIPCSIGNNYSTKALCDPADIEDCQVIGETTAFDPDSKVTCLSREYIMNLGSSTTEQNFSEEMEQFNLETGNWVQHNPGKYFEPLNYSNKDSKVDKPSVEQSPKLELKPLPE